MSAGALLGRPVAQVDGRTATSSLSGLEDDQERQLHEQFLRAKEEGLRLAKQRDEAANAAASQFAEGRLAQLPQESASQMQQLIPTWVTEEQYREWGYPPIDPKFKDKEWQRRQIELDCTDPRHNPNLNLDPSDPEFWYNAARKPFNKVLLRSEAHWDKRRQAWLQQKEMVEKANKSREVFAEQLEDCSIEVKRTLTPIMKYTITMTMLNNIWERAREQKKDFRQAIEEKENMASLQNIRRQVDAEGPQAAERLMAEYDARWRELAAKLHADKIEEERKERRVADVQTIASIINWGNKCKKDGLLEWEKGNWAEAHASWKQADEALRRFKAQDKEDDRLVMELHCAILKNLAQACIKLEYWTDAADAAEQAIALDPDDHKAWFRKACALEGLGQLDEAETCLRRVEECSVGRPDRERISRDTQARRSKLQAIRERGEAALKRTLDKALQEGVFSERRDQAVTGGGDAAQALEDRPEARRRPKPGPLGIFEESMRKHLTKEGAEDLLVDLRDAYRDTTFQRQIFKLARDVRMDKHEFLTNLKKVALPLQKPILEKWGFEASERGVLEMQRAIQDFTRGKRADPDVKRRADETTQALYGCMYYVLTRPDAPQSIQPPQLEVRLGTTDRGADADSD